MHEKNKYRHIPPNRYNLEKYRDINFWSYRPALNVRSIIDWKRVYGYNITSSVLQRAFSPEGLSEMWNEMVKDGEIVFDREESAHPGKKTRYPWILMDYNILLKLASFLKAFSFLKFLKCFNFSEDFADCSQKKDDTNDKEKKEEDEVAAATSFHHSIIEMWDWGRQPGGWWCLMTCSWFK